MASHPGRLLAAALLAGVVGGGLVVALWWLVQDSGDGRSSRAGSCNVVRVAERVLPSVVTLQARAPSAAGTGSGVIYRPGDDDREYIVTNEHVITPALADRGALRVTFSDGRTADAEVVGADTLTDVAVVRVDDSASPGTPVRIGDSEELDVGQPVVALGAPLGLSSTVTSGIVSATDRYIRVPSREDVTAHLVGAIQTDAAINPGNSGGALVDCGGRLVGINTAGATPADEVGSAGLGFAIPTSLMQRLTAELIDTGEVVHPTFGLQVRALTPDLAAQAGRTPGLLVELVAPGGPADTAGLRTGDIITAVGDEPMRTLDDLVGVELRTGIGEAVEIAFDRQGESSSVELVAEAADGAAAPR